MGPTELGKILSKTLRDVARKHRGDPEWQGLRTTYSIWQVAGVFLACVLEGVCPGVFYERLKRIRGYRRARGLPNRLISLSQLKKRMNTLMFLKALAELLRQSAGRALRGLGSEEVRVVAMDLTRIESDPDRDRYGAWGRDSQGLFWGYKLGLITSDSGVVLGMTLMKGNWTEFKVNRRLLKMARDVVRTTFGNLPVEYVVCDSGFDGESTFKTAHRELKASVLCPPRRKRNPKAKTAQNVLWNAMRLTPHRLHDQALWETDGIRDIFRKRGGIERVNGQLKDTGIRIQEIPPRRRGVKRLWPLCLAKLVIYNLALNVNIEQGRPIRRIKVLVA